nr:putative ribonuclease H-like domain-containing protein [Tanacetum cinerariifolium]
MKRIFKYIKGHPKLGLWYLRDSPFDLEAFSDSDYAGAAGDRKSTTGGCQFIGRRLISWQCKKQTIVATFSCEAESVAAASYCGQGMVSNVSGRHKFLMYPRFVQLALNITPTDTIEYDVPSFTSKAQQHHDQATGGSPIYEHPPILNPATLSVSTFEGAAEVPFTT